MTTLTKLRLAHEVDETLGAIVEKKKVDHFAAHDQEIQIRAAIYDRWTAGLNQSFFEIRRLGIGAFVSNKPTPDEVIAVLTKHLSGGALVKGLKDVLVHPVRQAFDKGRASVNVMAQRDGVQKDFMGGSVGFGEIFGLTEDHAVQALLDQLTVSAGGFWDDQLSSSIRDELVSFFEGSVTRDEMVAKIEAMTNTRLATDGEKSLPRSYFDNLATHQIVRARNVGSFYRAKSLGASHYTLVNPHDARTSDVCLEVTQGQVYTMAGAEDTITGILTAGSVSDLKAVAPFYTKASDVRNPVPPLHWPKCRTWMNFVFEG